MFEAKSRKNRLVVKKLRQTKINPATIPKEILPTKSTQFMA